MQLVPSNGCLLPPFSAAGISRSVTIVVMYIMTVSTLGFEEALTVVQYCREMANPNFGFRMQLRKYSETKLEEVSILHSGGREIGVFMVL